MADTPTGETGTPQEPKNEQANQSTPPVVNTEDNAVVEELRKKLAQQEMRANQLANKLEAEEKAKAEAEAKKLEEQNEFKTLYEQERARREAIETEKEAAEREAALRKATNDVLAEYPDEVKVVAAETGLQLADVDDASLEIFKQKIEKISTVVGKQKVAPNNPNAPKTPEYSVTNAEGIVEAPLQGSRFDEYVKAHPGMASMMTKK